MDSCYTGDRIAGDHIQTDITACNIEEPLHKYRLGKVGTCKHLLGGGGHKHAILGLNWPSASAVV